MSDGFEIVQIFARKRANASQIFFDFGALRMQKLAWRALRALRNVHDVSVALGRVSAAFGNEIARFKHSTLEIVKKITRKKVKKRTNVWRASASRT